MATIRVKNPHSVLAALEMRPDDVVQITLPRDVQSDAKGAESGDAWVQVAKLAKANGVQIITGSPGFIPKGSRDKGSHKEEGGRTSVAEAIIKEKEPVSAEELFSNAKDRAKGQGLWLALDSLQDPQNVGAIFRAAAFFGVQGIMLTQERSAPMSASVYDVSSGGVEYVPFTLQTNLQRGFEVAKDAGLWILGTSEHAHDSLDSIQRDRPWLLVLGNEEKGMRRLTEESCDVLCKIPVKGRVTSLNVSVAAGIFISRFS